MNSRQKNGKPYLSNASFNKFSDSEKNYRKNMFVREKYILYNKG